MNGQRASDRRHFLKQGAASGAGLAAGSFAAPAIAQQRNANETLFVGFIGVGNRGTQLLRRFMSQPDVRVAGLCDVYAPYRTRQISMVAPEMRRRLGGRIPPMGEEFGYDVPRYEDFRNMLDRSDIDAVVIATPDHWHAVQTIQACQSGKDVYVEKPLSVTLYEGRKMVEAARQTKRVVQVGLHRRSSKAWGKAAQLVQEQRVGKVSIASAYRISNMFPNGIGNEAAQEPVDGLNWDLWLGPRPERPFQPNLPLYMFRWWQAYSSQVGNWGVHYFDAMRWALGSKAPRSVSAHGGRFALQDDRTIPDTMQVICEVPEDALLMFAQYEACEGAGVRHGEVDFRGTLGTLYGGWNGDGYKIVPARGGQFQPNEPYTDAEEADGFDGDVTTQHIRNFLDCMKSRETPNSDIESGHRSTSFSHLANIALAVEARIEWDAENERCVGNEAANALLHYPYRQPWSL